MDPAVAAFLQSLQAAGLSQTQIATLATVQNDPVTWSALYNAQIQANTQQTKPTASTDTGTGAEFVTPADRMITIQSFPVPAPTRPPSSFGAADFIHLPSWGPTPPIFQKIEDRIDSALSSANSILNFVLGPVRHFVGAVLHPVIALADTVFGWASHLLTWLMGEALELGYSTIKAVERLAADGFHLFLVSIDTAVTEARKLVADVRAFASFVAGQAVDVARSLAADVVNIARQLAADAVNLARSLVDDVHAYATFIVGQTLNVARQLAADAVNLARGLAADAVNIARTLADDARTFAAFIAGHAVQLARDLAAGAERLAHDLVSTLWRDIVQPLEHRLTSFFEHEWQWAYRLLKLVEDAGEWLVWVGRHLVPEAVDTYRALRDLLDFDADELAGVGAAIAVHHN